MQRLPVEVEAQPEREGPFAVHRELGAVPPVSPPDLLRTRGQGEDLVRHHRVWVLFPLCVDRVVARRQRVAGRPHPLCRAALSSTAASSAVIVSRCSPTPASMASRSPSGSTPRAFCRKYPLRSNSVGLVPDRLALLVAQEPEPVAGLGPGAQHVPFARLPIGAFRVRSRMSCPLITEQRHVHLGFLAQRGGKAEPGEHCVWDAYGEVVAAGLA